MYTNILVPLDGSKSSEQILPYARLLAGAFHIPVNLLHVQGEDIALALTPPQQDREYLSKIAEEHFPRSTKIRYNAEMGKPAELIVERAAVDHSTIIAMATHGMSGMRRWVLGSTASKVVRSAENPVLLVRPFEAEPHQPILLKTLLVPLDGSMVAEKIFPHVIALANALDLEANLVRVHRTPLESYTVGVGLPAGVFSEPRDAVQNPVMEYLDGRAQSLEAEGLRRVNSFAMEGDAAGEIIDAARKTAGCMIAMTTHGESGIKRWLLGSVAEKVVQHSAAPVLLIRPDMT
jgi:nucleotide-binding universal stress UspA family protein